MDYALSFAEIIKISRKRLTLVPYDEVYTYKDVRALFATPYVVLNYLTGPNYGHWVALYWNKKANSISYLDSYGNIPDKALDFISEPARTKYFENYPYLMSLLDRFAGSVHYNKVKLQKWGEKYKTCGRWVGYYLRVCNKVSMEEFESAFMSIKKEYPKLGYDYMITAITTDLF